jgi:hypothetical protein
MSAEVLTYKRVPFTDEIRNRIERATVRAEHEGGLGDIFYQVHQNTNYDNLVALNPGETGSVVIVSHNPFAREIFEWLPTSGQIIVANCGFEDIRKPSFRASVNLPKNRPSTTHRPPITPLKFYPAPSDSQAIVELEKLKPFVVMAASGSYPSKSIPVTIADRLTNLAIEHGLNVVQIGRTYRIFISGEDNDPHNELKLEPRAGLYSMIDRLTVPGVAATMNMASGVIAPNTASLILSYCQARPTLFCAYQFDWDTFISSAPAGYMFRLFDPLNRHFHLDKYDDSIPNEFFKGVPR